MLARTAAAKKSSKTIKRSQNATQTQRSQVKDINFAAFWAKINYRAENGCRAERTKGRERSYWGACNINSKAPRLPSAGILGTFPAAASLLQLGLASSIWFTTNWQRLQRANWACCRCRCRSWTQFTSLPLVTCPPQSPCPVRIIMPHAPLTHMSTTMQQPWQQLPKCPSNLISGKCLCATRRFSSFSQCAAGCPNRSLSPLPFTNAPLALTSTQYYWNRW